MLKDMFFNKKIWTILLTLILLFTVVNGLRYLGLYEGMEAGTPPATSGMQTQLTTTYDF